jgi:hypothetical protein
LPVLVEEPAEQVTSLYSGLAILVDEVQTSGWTRRLQPERPMRSVRVVVLDVDPEHLFQVAHPLLVAGRDPAKLLEPPDHPSRRGWSYLVGITASL